MDVSCQRQKCFDQEKSWGSPHGAKETKFVANAGNGKDRPEKQARLSGTDGGRTRLRDLFLDVTRFVLCRSVRVQFH